MLLRILEICVVKGNYNRGHYGHISEKMENEFEGVMNSDLHYLVVTASAISCKLSK